jgi:hypothetical protein
VGLPLNLLLPKSSRGATTDDTVKPHISLDWPMIVLGLAFAASWAVVTAMAVHLPRLLEAAGANAIQAVTAGAHIGPSQVGARILEASLMKRFHPMVSARLSVALHPIGAAVLAMFGAAAASAPFTILHGAKRDGSSGASTSPTSTPAASVPNATASQVLLPIMRLETAVASTTPAETSKRALGPTR